MPPDNELRPREGAARTSAKTSTKSLTARSDQQDIFGFLAGESARIRDHNVQRVRASDPDGFNGAQAAILQAIDEYGTATSDDVVWPARGNELGAAFFALRRSGRIECVGYATSRRPQAHSRLVRVWRRA